MEHVVIDRYFSLFLKGLKIFLNPRLSLIGPLIQYSLWSSETHIIMHNVKLESTEILEISFFLFFYIYSFSFMSSRDVLKIDVYSFNNM